METSESLKASFWNDVTPYMVFLFCKAPTGSVL